MSCPDISLLEVSSFGSLPSRAPGTIGETPEASTFHERVRESITLGWAFRAVSLHHKGSGVGVRGTPG